MPLLCPCMQTRIYLNKNSALPNTNLGKMQTSRFIPAWCKQLRLLQDDAYNKLSMCMSPLLPGCPSAWCMQKSTMWSLHLTQLSHLFSVHPPADATKKKQRISQGSPMRMSLLHVSASVSLAWQYTWRKMWTSTFSSACLLYIPRNNPVCMMSSSFLYLSLMHTRKYSVYVTMPAKAIGVVPKMGKPIFGSQVPNNSPSPVATEANGTDLIHFFCFW